VTAHAALDRLAPQDFYRQLDWIRDGWNGDEDVMARKLSRLRRTFEHLPTRYYEQSTAPLEVLARARIANDVPWQSALRQLVDIVNEWDSSRPPILDCEVCGIAVRGHPALSNHYMIVHPEHARPLVPSA
jgi:hypothetical protein